MLPRHKAGEPVTVYPSTPGGEDAHGNPMGGFGTPVTYPYCAVAPSSTEEPEEPGRTPVVQGITVYGPADMVVGPHDEVEHRGDRFRVVGEVGAPQNPFSGSRPGVFFRAERVSG